MSIRAWVRPVGIAGTVFGCGWVLMGMEMVGGRLLSPYFGSGVSVWGSVISIFLIALSAGYFIGGVLSQRYPHAVGMTSVILLAAASVLPVAAWHQPVAAWFADRGLSEQWGALLAAGTLFFVPSALLGMISPYAVRLVARRVATAGLSAGTLYAISTLGSFLGCLATAFYLILWIGIRSILLVFSSTLLVIAAWHLWLWYIGRPSPAPDGTIGDIRHVRILAPAGILIGVLVVASVLSGGRAEVVQGEPILSVPVVPSHRVNNRSPGLESWQEDDNHAADALEVQPEAGPVSDLEGASETWIGERLLFEKESLYHLVRVTETDGVRHLRFRRAGGEYEESVIRLDDPLRFEMYYYSTMLAAFAHQPDPRTVLFIGLGGGTLSIAIHHYFPNAHIDNVELDPVVADAARKFFNFRTGARMTLYVADGRVQVRRFLRQRKRYDVIMVDAFRGGYIPYHLTTREFMDQLKALLTPKGVVVSNLLPGFESYHYHRRTMTASFRNQWSYGAGSNVTVVTSMRSDPPSQSQLIATAERLQEEKQFTVNLPAIVAEGGVCDDYEKTGRILTDDYAPMDVLRAIPAEDRPDIHRP